MTNSKSKNTKKAKMARGSVDKAQTKLIVNNQKAIKELMGEQELKYSISFGRQVAVSFPDMITTATRRAQIVPIRIGSLTGITDNDRIGDRVSLQTIQLRYALNLANGALVAADEYNRVRIIMFWDNQPTSYPTSGIPITNPPEWSQILQTVDPGIAQQSELACLSTFDNDQWPPRYQKVYDKVHTLTSNGNTATAVGMGSRFVTGDNKFFKQYAGRKISYNRSGQVAMNRQLYFAYISDSTVAQHPFLDYFIKCTYTDS